MSANQTVKKSSATNMTEGNVLRQMVLFSLPLMVGMFIQQLYNLVDSAVVGRFVSSAALAAVGGSGVILNLMTAIFSGMSVGANVVIGQHFGAGNSKQVSLSIHSTAFLTIVIALATTIAGWFLTPALLRLLNTPADVIGDAILYLRIIFLGMFGNMAYNMTSAALRAIGDSKNPLIFLIIASLTNLVLDLVFVIVFHWGVMGVAVATAVSQLISAIFGIYKLTRFEEQIRLNIRKIKPDKENTVNIIKMGVPAAVQTGILQVGFMVVQGLLNSFGSAAMAGTKAAQSIESILRMPMSALGTAVLTFTAQNYGSGKYKRILSGLKINLVMNIILTLLVILVVVLFSPALMRIFTEDEAVIEAGVKMLHTLIPWHMFLSIQGVYMNVMRGMGKTMVIMVVSILSSILGRVVIGYALTAYLQSIVGVYLGIAADFVLSCVIIMIIFYFFGFYKKLKSEPESVEA